MKAAAIDLLARDVREARVKRRMTVLQLAHQVGISESALRRIENGTSRNARGETLMLILDWASRRGFTEFAGFSIRRAYGEGLNGLPE